jgi:hypothetical protein
MSGTLPAAKFLKMDNAFPEQTTIEFAPLDEIRSPILHQGVDHWIGLSGKRSFPSREELRPRAIAGAMSHMVLVKVIDGGADFEFRIVGDAAAASASRTLRARTPASGPA